MNPGFMIHNPGRVSSYDHQHCSLSFAAKFSMIRLIRKPLRIEAPAPAYTVGYIKPVPAGWLWGLDSVIDQDQVLAGDQQMQVYGKAWLWKSWGWVGKISLRMGEKTRDSLASGSVIHESKVYNAHNTEHIRVQGKCRTEEAQQREK